jgi:WW domain/Leucine Rich repeat
LKKQLDLRCCNIGHEEAKVIAKELSFNATLVSLGLEINSVGDIGASALVVALQKNKTLTLLNLENNGIGALGAKSLAQTLTKNRSLQVLGLGGNPIGDGGAVNLAAALPSNSSLSQMSLVKSGIGDEGVIALARGLRRNSSLKMLYLGENKFTTKGLASLAEALKEHRSLKVLRLDVNFIDDEGASILAEALTKNSRLEELSLQQNSIGDKGGTALLTALKGSNRSITTLDLTRNSSLSPTLFSSINSIVKANKSGTRPTDAAKQASSLPRQAPATAGHESVRRVAITKEKPTAVPQAPSLAASAWEAKTDSKGQTYYVNHETKTTQWAVPPCFSRQGALATQAASDLRAMDKSVAGSESNAAVTRPQFASPLSDNSSGGDGTSSFPRQRAELEFEICRLTAIRDACLDTLDEDQWQASVEAEKKIRQVQEAISSGEYPTGDELDRMVNDLTDAIREKVRNDSVAAALPLRGRLVELRENLAREREAQARIKKESRNSSITESISSAGIPTGPEVATAVTPSRNIGLSKSRRDSGLPSSDMQLLSNGFIPTVARSPLPPYDGSDRERPIEVDFTYRSRKTFLSNGSKGKNVDIFTPLSKTSRLSRLDNRGGGGSPSDPEDEVNVAVSVNSYRLNKSQITWFYTEFKIHMRPNQCYWYDKSSGFFGKIGKMPSCVIDPGIPLMGDLHQLSSVGVNGPGSGVVINGRCIDRFELEVFYEYGMNEWVEGQRYIIDPTGDVRVEAQPGYPATSPLYNWKERAGVVKSDCAEQRERGHRSPSSLVASVYDKGNVTTSRSQEFRPPPPPYPSSSMNPLTESFRRPSNSAPLPPPPPYDKSNIPPGTAPPPPPNYENSIPLSRPSGSGAPMRHPPYPGISNSLVDTNGSLGSQMSLLGLSGNRKKGGLTVQVETLFNVEQTGPQVEIESEDQACDESSDQEGEGHDGSCTGTDTHGQSPECPEYQNEHEQDHQKGEQDQDHVQEHHTTITDNDNQEDGEYTEEPCFEEEAEGCSADY